MPCNCPPTALISNIISMCSCNQYSFYIFGEWKEWFLLILAIFKKHQRFANSLTCQQSMFLTTNYVQQRWVRKRMLKHSRDELDPQNPLNSVINPRHRYLSCVHQEHNILQKLLKSVRYHNL
uniref:Uncharacterized protein n=1 Tax=Arundo donax TaxID=35708 RepID=A0A0A9EZI6_ARUDO